MAKLCQACQSRPQPSGQYHGQCQGHASTNCKAWTEDFALVLCDQCAEELGRCAWCLGPLDGSWGAAVVPTTKQFVRRFETDSGSHVSDMKAGEQILVQLQVNLYSYVTWRVEKLDDAITFAGYRMIRDQQNFQYATLEMYFDLNEAAERAEILLVEAPDYGRYRGWTPPPPKNVKRWRCSAEIKH